MKKVWTSSRQQKPDMTDTSVMRQMSVLHRNKGKATEYGSPGSSSTLSHRVPLLRWRRMSLAGKAGVTAIVTAFGTVIAYAGTNTVQGAVTGASVTLGVFLMLLAVLTAPGALTAGLTLLVTIALLPAFGSVYTAAATGSGDPVGGALALFFSLAIAVFIGIRWGRGRAWVTVMMLALSLAIPGLAIIWIFPELGLNAARISLILVLLGRCGGFAWISGTTGLLWDRIRYGRDDDNILAASEADPDDKNLEWKRQAVADRETADELRELPEEYTVFYDVTVPKTNQHVGAVVVGPTGLKLVASAHAHGPVHVTDKGLVVPKVDMDSIVWNLMQQRLPLAKVLRVHPRDVELLVVIHGSPSLERTTVSVRDLDDYGKQIDTLLTIAGTDNLKETITSQFPLWSALKCRQVSRLARMRLIHIPVPNTAKVWAPASMTMTVLDEDGREITPMAVTGSATSRELHPGDKVSLQGDGAIIQNLRVVGAPSVDESTGVTVVRVCKESEWTTTTLDISNPETLVACYVVPVEALILSPENAR